MVERGVVGLTGPLVQAPSVANIRADAVARIRYRTLDDNLTPPEDAALDPAHDDVDPRPEDDSRQAEGSPSRLYRINPDLEPGLYVVSTPIGNLRDITLRALDTLASVDTVCAEDTRVAAKLLQAFGLSARLRPYHDHNGAQARPQLLNELQTGGRIALISDAGTPLVSDPGFKLVREAAALGIKVVAIPGASAPLAALASSGLPTDRFTFAGFPPPKSRRASGSWASLRASAARWFSSRGCRGWRQALPTWRRCWACAKAWWRAS